MELKTIGHIIFGTLFVGTLVFLIRAIFQTIRGDFWKSGESNLNEKNEKNIIRDESNAARDSNNALLWGLTGYTIANMFNQNKDSDQNKGNEENDGNNEENNGNDEQSLENENSDFEQNFDDFDGSFDSSFDSGGSDDGGFDGGDY